MTHTRCRPGPATLALLTCFATWSALVSPAFGAIYFVDAVAGKDSNNGLTAGTTEKNAGPWRTLARATAARLAPGDSVLLKRGQVFREPLVPHDSGRAEEPITFAAYGDGAPPTISGGEPVGDWIAGQRGRYHAALTVRPSVVIADKQWLRPVEAPNYLEPNTWFYEHVGKLLYVRLAADRNPNEILVEAAIRDRVVFVFDQSHLHFQGLTVELAAGDFEGVYCRGRHNVFRSITARFHHRSGLKITGLGSLHCAVVGGTFNANGSSGIDVESNRAPQKLSHVEIIDNHCYDNRWSWGQDGYGIKLTWVDDSVVRGNVCHDNISSGINLDGGGRPIDGCDRNIVEHNECYRNGASGIELEYASDDNVIRYNFCHDNTGETYWGAGIMITEASARNRVLYNVVRDQGGTGHCYIVWNGAQTTTFENNVAISSKPGVIGFYLENGPVAHHTSLTNNIYRGRSVALFVETSDATGFRSDFNCWHRTNQHDVIAWNGAWMTLSTFRDRFGHEQSSIGTDPKLLNPATAEFGLAAASPCIDRGTDVGHGRDLHGNPVPQGSAPDIGAVESRAAPY